jgi:ParB family chromosome partitioning protein
MALRALHARSGEARYAHVQAVLRDPAAMGGAFAAMIEENEIRAGLSHFERGRIAVIAAEQGAFANVEAAVAALFPVASKAKRSKIRSFALVYEELGDMLSFAQTLSEKAGLRLAAALRDGAEARLRIALAQTSPASAEEEGAAIEAALLALTTPAPDLRRGGRPRRQALPRIRLASGFELAAREEAAGWSIQVGGSRRIDRELIATLMREMERLLDRAETGAGNSDR